MSSRPSDDTLIAPQNGTGAPGIWLSDGERVILDIERTALLPHFVPPSDGEDGWHPEIGYERNGRKTTVVHSLGLNSVMQSPVVDLRPDGQNTIPRPARMVITNQRLLFIGPSGAIDETALDDVVEVVESQSEPCTVFVTRKKNLAVLVAKGDLDRVRAAVHTALQGEDAHVAAGEDVLGAEGSTVPTTADDGSQPKRRLVANLSMSDRIFHAGAWAGGLSVLAIMVVVGMFLLLRALKALQATGFSFITTQEWQPDIHHFGIAAVLSLTVMIAAVALVVSVPLAVGTALFISEVAPRRFKQLFVSMVDLMAAVPSIVYGLWGLFFLQGHVIGLSRWLSTWFAWIPIFRVDGAEPGNPLASESVFTASTFVAGLVVALMVIPISCSIMREVFSQAPPGEREGAFALGATRWGVIKTVVLPFGKGGMIGAIMLGLGRALGETIAVYLIISPVFRINTHILQSGSNSVASLIVLRQGDASGFGLSALMAAGLSLFILTLIVNFAASAIIARSRSGAESEA
jgi:phosphate transport system permease protein